MKYLIQLRLPSYLLLVSLLLLSSCSKDVPPTPPRTWEDTVKDFQDLDLSPGVRDVSVQAQEGVFWDFRLVVPDLATGETAPLFFDFHGESNGSNTAHTFSYDCYLKEGLSEIKSYMIIPNAGVEQWYQRSNQIKIRSLLELAINNLPVDKDKVVSMGYSNGGNATWYFNENLPEIFSAGIAMASSYNPQNLDGSYKSYTTPLYVIHGENDDLFPVEQTEEFCNKTRDAGSDVTFVIAEGLDHYEPCLYVDYVKDAAVWLQEEVWK